jgi:hypothetical protein
MIAVVLFRSESRWVVACLVCGGRIRRETELSIIEVTNVSRRATLRTLLLGMGLEEECVCMLLIFPNCFCKGTQAFSKSLKNKTDPNLLSVNSNVLEQG